MDEDDLCGEQYASFWNALGGRVDMSQIAEGTPDEDPAPSAEHSVLVKVSDATEDGADGGEMKYVDVTPEDHKLLRTMLDSDDVFILRPKVADRLYTWIGRGSTLAEKKAATSAATGYLEKVLKSACFRSQSTLSLCIFSLYHSSVCLPIQELSVFLKVTRIHHLNKSFLCGR